MYEIMNINKKKRILKNLKEIEVYTHEERKLYFDKLQEYCKNRRVHKTTNDTITNLIGKIAPLFRSYKVEIRGAENVPDETAVFLCNIIENEYHFDSQGHFVPEIIEM